LLWREGAARFALEGNMGQRTSMRGLSPWEIRIPSLAKDLLAAEEPTVTITPTGNVSGTYLVVSADAPDPMRYRMLAVAAGSGRRDLVDLFLSAGADPNQRLDNGWTPLMCAAIGGHVEIVEDLLQAGADPDLDASERTALDLAVEAQEIEVVEYLRLRRVRELRWCEQRGVSSFQLRQDFLLIRGGVDDSVRAIARTRNIARHEPRIHGRKITVARESYLALQFAGHQWTIIVPVCSSRTDAGIVNSRFAREISSTTSNQAVLFVSREDRLGYELFERGASLETLSYGELDPVSDSRPVSFRSTRRNVSQALLGFPERLVDSFIRELDTLIPGIAFRTHPGITLSVLPELRRDDFSRIDHLTLE
jgi:hypothetical protein